MSNWKNWLTPSRLLPLLTILGAGTAIVLSLIDMLQLTTAEEIIIALLAVIAVDALNERLNLLEKIELRLSSLGKENVLKSRQSLRPPFEVAKYSSEICLCVIHGSSIISPYLGFYENRMRDGCNIRIILLDPESASIETLNSINRHSNTKQHICSALDTLSQLIVLNARGTCEVRLAKTFIPFSMFAIDISQKSGSMNVEYYAYKIAIDDKPHVHLTALNSPYWFAYYKQQFEKVWADSVTWTPNRN